MDDRRRTLMILGAGPGQMTAIRKAKEMGLRVVATSNRPHDPGLAVADVPLLIDTRDAQANLAAARRHRIDGVMTLSTDVAMPTLGRIVDALELPGPGFEVTVSASDKIQMKQKLTAAGVPTARFCVIASLEEAIRSAQEIGFPLIIKPPDSSGSRGVTRITDMAALELGFRRAQAISRSGAVILEEYLEGIEFGAQVLVCDGVQSIFFHNDTVTPPPISVPLGHSYPCKFDDTMQQRCAEVVTAAVAALGIEQTFVNADLILTRRGPMVLEIAARLGGTCLPELTSIFTGEDIVGAAIRLALGEKVRLGNHRQQPCAARIIDPPKSGWLRRFEVPPALARLPGVVAIRRDVEPGAHVHAFSSGPDRIGEILTTGKSWQEAEALCERIRREIVLEIDSGEGKEAIDAVA